MDVIGKHARVRIYLGEDKRHGNQPLSEAIVLKARQLHMAGATVVRGTAGFGRSTRLHTADVVFLQDWPVVVELVETHERIRDFVLLLTGFKDIGLIISEEVSVLLYEPLHA